MRYDVPGGVAIQMRILPMAQHPARIREEVQKRPLRAAIREAIARTGGTVTAAGTILTGTFAVLAVVSNDDQARVLGFGVAAGILMETFLIRTLLIPHWWCCWAARTGGPPRSSGVLAPASPLKHLWKRSRRCQHADQAG